MSPADVKPSGVVGSGARAADVAVLVVHRRAQIDLAEVVRADGIAAVVDHPDVGVAESPSDAAGVRPATRPRAVRSGPRFSVMP